MTIHEAKQDLNAGDDVCLKVAYRDVPADFHATIEFLFKSSDYAGDEHKFNKKFYYLIAGAETWELTKETKAPVIGVRDHRTGENLK